jgi:hypothetical protein
MEIEELVSACCESHHDEMFSYDEEWNMGTCNLCKEHSEFKTIKEWEVYYGK